VPWFSSQPPTSACALPSPLRRWPRPMGDTLFHSRGRQGLRHLGPTGSLRAKFSPFPPSVPLTGGPLASARVTGPHLRLPRVADQRAQPCHGPARQAPVPWRPRRFSPPIARVADPWAPPARARPCSCPAPRMPGPLTSGTRRLALASDLVRPLLISVVRSRLDGREAQIPFRCGLFA
jgi:hypothetical protein